MLSRLRNGSSTTPDQPRVKVIEGQVVRMKHEITKWSRPPQSQGRRALRKGIGRRMIQRYLPPDAKYQASPKLSILLAQHSSLEVAKECVKTTANITGRSTGGNKEWKRRVKQKGKRSS